MFTNKSEEQCSAGTMGLLSAWLGVYILFVPLFVFVLFVGYRRCTSKTSPSSNSDIFILNMIVTEILNIVGVCVYLIGFYSKNRFTLIVGQIIVLVAVVGQMAFHNLICVERYLAVVHPITYMHLKTRGGVKVRNISIGCTWAFSVFIALATFFIGSGVYQYVFVYTLPFVSILVVSFCSASVLRVLIRPQPGEVGGDIGAIDQSKRMAFYTMIATLGALLARFIIVIASYLFSNITTLDMETKCFLVLSSYWFSIPSSLISPLLFLRRAGKLPKCK